MQKISGLLLVQLGSPASLDVESIADYLYEFLGDWHTIGKKLFFWKFLLRHCILPKGKFKSFAKYKRMFDRNGFSEMPLVTHSNEFLKNVRKAMPGTCVKLAYQYGCKPSVKNALEAFQKKGISKIHVVAMYPQRSGVTTEAANDIVLKTAKQIGFKGELLFANGFCDTQAWQREISDSIREQLESDDTLVVSCHSIQSARIAHGDPYKHDCKASVKAIENLLGVKAILAYQSKVGRGKWLGPSLIETVQKLGAEQKPIVIVSPAFTADNLETISEIDDEVAGIYHAAGGTRLKRIPCLNARPSWVKAFVEEILPNLDFKSL